MISHPPHPPESDVSEASQADWNPWRFSDPPLFENAGPLPERALRGHLRGAAPSGPARKEPEPEELLAAAVVRQAAEDWRLAAEALRRRPENSAARARKRETEAFFRSRWFHTLVDLDGEAFLRRLQGGDPSPARASSAGPRDPARRLRRRLLRIRRGVRKPSSRRSGVVEAMK